MADRCPNDLKRLYREGRVLPFVGAGASMAAQWSQDGETVNGPSWREMVAEACRQLDYEDPELLRMRGSDLQILEYFAIKYWLCAKCLMAVSRADSLELAGAQAQ
jgi:hypothetical protein